MSVYIKGMGNISPQKTWDESGLLDPTFGLCGRQTLPATNLTIQNTSIQSNFGE